MISLMPPRYMWWQFVTWVGWMLTYTGRHTFRRLHVLGVEVVQRAHSERNALLDAERIIKP